jgi:hypothetical protein
VVHATKELQPEATGIAQSAAGMGAEAEGTMRRSRWRAALRRGLGGRSHARRILPAETKGAEVSFVRRKGCAPVRLAREMEGGTPMRRRWPELGAGDRGASCRWRQRARRHRP